MPLFRADRLQAARAAAQALADQGDAAQRADAHTLLARIARRQGRLDEALADSGQAVEAAQQAADPARECRARVQRAHALNALGRIEKATDEAHEARQLAEASGDAGAQAAAAEALGAVQWAMARWPEALASFQRMQALAAAAADVDLQAVAHGSLASVEGELARQATDPAQAQAGRQRALHHAGEYLRLATAAGDVHAVRSARHNQAVAQLGLGDRTAARLTLQAVHDEAGEDGGVAAAIALLNLAEMDLQDGQPAAALQRLQAAHALLAPTGDAAYLQSCCRLLCDVHEALGAHAEALHWHKQFHAHYAQLASDRAQMHARALEVKYETGRAQAEATFNRLRAERFERASLEDGLTGIANRRAFDAALADLHQGLAQGRCFALALIDVDHFKDINDRHSHQVGDEVLRRVGRLLSASCREMDLAARYGGEEFGLLLPGVSPATALGVCERVRAAVEREDWHRLSPGLQVRVSVGCVTAAAGQANQSLAALLAQADQRLYAAKQGGRNRVVAEAPLPPQR